MSQKSEDAVLIHLQTSQGYLSLYFTDFWIIIEIICSAEQSFFKQKLRVLLSAWGQGLIIGIWIPALPLTNCMPLNKLINLCASVSPKWK